jgi:uncharacterized iron-regulated membrane protein
MKKFKKAIRIIHLWLGLITGLVVFIVAITGSIFTFEEEIRSVTDKQLLEVGINKSENYPRKSIAEMTAIVKEKFPKPPLKSIRISNEPNASVEFILKDKTSIYINPYSGQILGTGNHDTDFFGTVLRLHRSLLLGDTGKVITGTSALIFIIMIISGIILWWPKSKANRKHKFSIKKNALRPRKIYDLHSVLGFYAAWVLIFTATTGIIWSFDWVEDTMFWITNSKKDDRKLHSREVLALDFGIDDMLQKAKSLSPDAKDIFINLPEDSMGVVRVNMQAAEGGFSRKNDQFIYDRYTGELLRAKYFEDASTGEKIKSMNYNIHTGKALGLAGQFLVFFSALIAASLPVTGLLMWLKKRKLKLESLE